MKLTAEQRSLRLLARTERRERRRMARHAQPLTLLSTGLPVWSDDPRLVLTPSERRWKRLGYYVLGPLVVVGFVVLMALAGGGPA